MEPENTNAFSQSIDLIQRSLSKMGICSEFISQKMDNIEWCKSMFSIIETESVTLDTKYKFFQGISQYIHNYQVPNKQKNIIRQLIILKAYKWAFDAPTQSLYRQIHKRIVNHGQYQTKLTLKLWNEQKPQDIISILYTVKEYSSFFNSQDVKRGLINFCQINLPTLIQMYIQNPNDYKIKYYCFKTICKALDISKHPFLIEKSIQCIQEIDLKRDNFYNIFIHSPLNSTKYYVFKSYKWGIKLICKLLDSRGYSQEYKPRIQKLFTLKGKDIASQIYSFIKQYPIAERTTQIYKTIRNYELYLLLQFAKYQPSLMWQLLYEQQIKCMQYVQKICITDRQLSQQEIIKTLKYNYQQKSMKTVLGNFYTKIYQLNYEAQNQQRRPTQITTKFKTIIKSVNIQLQKIQNCLQLLKQLQKKLRRQPGLSQLVQAQLVQQIQHNEHQILRRNIVRDQQIAICDSKINFILKQLFSCVINNQSERFKLQFCIDIITQAKMRHELIRNIQCKQLFKLIWTYCSWLAQLGNYKNLQQKLKMLIMDLKQDDKDFKQILFKTIEQADSFNLQQKLKKLILDLKQDDENEQILFKTVELADRFITDELSDCYAKKETKTLSDQQQKSFMKKCMIACQFSRIMAQIQIYSIKYQRIMIKLSYYLMNVGNVQSQTVLTGFIKTSSDNYHSFVLFYSPILFQYYLYQFVPYNQTITHISSSSIHQQAIQKIYKNRTRTSLIDPNQIALVLLILTKNLSILYNLQNIHQKNRLKTILTHFLYQLRLNMTRKLANKVYDIGQLRYTFNLIMPLIQYTDISILVSIISQVLFFLKIAFNIFTTNKSIQKQATLVFLSIKYKYDKDLKALQDKKNVIIPKGLNQFKTYKESLIQSLVLYYPSLIRRQFKGIYALGLSKILHGISFKYYQNTFGKALFKIYLKVVKYECKHLIQSESFIKGIQQKKWNQIHKLCQDCDLQSQKLENVLDQNQGSYLFPKTKNLIQYQPDEQFLDVMAYFEQYICQDNNLPQKVIVCLDFYKKLFQSKQQVLEIKRQTFLRIYRIARLVRNAIIEIQPKQNNRQPKKRIQIWKNNQEQKESERVKLRLKIQPKFYGKYQGKPKK